VKRKILIVSASFYPQNSPRSFRTTELVKEFARQGHDVTLYTIKDKEIHGKFEKDYGVTIKDLGQPKYKEINFNSPNRFISIYKRLLRRALLWLFEYPDVGLMFQVKNALKKESGYDLLISIAVPHPVHWGTAKAWNEKKPIAKTWVADSGDPYMGVSYDRYGKPFYFKFLEKSWGKKSTYMAITNINMKQNYYPEFNDKIVEITQGFNFEGIDRNENVQNDVPTFAFAGTFMKSVRNPTKFLQYLSSLKAPFKFVVYTKGPELLTPFKETLGDKLELRKFIPRTELLGELKKMDFLVNIGYDPVLQSPSKLIDYYMTGRPILSLEGDKLDEKLIDQFLQGDYSGKFEVENFEQYDIKNVAQKFLNLIK
jgi:hypothetical protein